MKRIIFYLLVFICVMAFTSCKKANSIQQEFETNNNGAVESQQEAFDTEIILGDAGEYLFYNVKAEAYLSCENNDLILSADPYKWTLEEVEEKNFYICAENTNFVLDIDNAFVAQGTRIKTWTKTGYDVQIWNISKNANGTYSVLYSENNAFCLGMDNGKAVLQNRDNHNSFQEWKVISITEPYQRYLSYTSAGEIIELRLPIDILNVISEPLLKQWADNLERAYHSYYELTNFIPYEKIIVNAYEPSEHIGWVIDNSNIIHIDNTFIYEDLKKMTTRNNDWNFCALHEMGHMFDFGRPWNFEAELMTDLKLAYVLEQNNVGAAPSEFDASVIFYGEDIINAYKILGADFSDKYNIFGCAERFLQIKKDIGWEPFKKAFHFLQENAALYSTYTKQEQFYEFIELLSMYSNKDIKLYFSMSEWSVIENQCG